MLFYFKIRACTVKLDHLEKSIQDIEKIHIFNLFLKIWVFLLIFYYSNFKLQISVFEKMSLNILTYR